MSTNSSLMDELMGQLQGPALKQMADQLALDPAVTGQAVSAALPLLVGALGRNAQQAGGAQALLGALQRDHNSQGALNLGGLLGSVLGGGGSGGALGGLGGLLGSVLGGGGQPASRQLDAGGILEHVLGSARPRAEASLGQSTGLNSGQAGKLLMMLAPMVMAALGQRVKAGQLDAGGLSQLLGQEQGQMQQQGGVGADLLASLLDQNGDGKLDMGDLMQLGSKLLGGRR